MFFSPLLFSIIKAALIVAPIYFVLIWAFNRLFKPMPDKYAELYRILDESDTGNYPLLSPILACVSPGLGNDGSDNNDLHLVATLKRHDIGKNSAMKSRDYGVEVGYGEE